MKTYKFLMIETVKKVVKVEAENYDEAEELAFETTDMTINFDNYEWEANLIEGDFD